MKPTIFVTVGLPASGKTYFTERLAKAYGIFFLNCDLLRLAMYKNPTFKPYEHATVFGAAGFIVEQHAKQARSIVCNANYNSRATRQKTRTLAQRHGMEYRIIWVQTPLEIITGRIQERDHDIPFEKMVDAPLVVLEKMQRTLQEPHSDEPAIIIDGTMPFTLQLEQFRQQAHEFAAPSLE